MRWKILAIFILAATIALILWPHKKPATRVSAPAPVSYAPIEIPKNFVAHKLDFHRYRKAGFPVPPSCRVTDMAEPSGAVYIRDADSADHQTFYAPPGHKLIFSCAARVPKPGYPKTGTGPGGMPVGFENAHYFHIRFEGTL